MFRRRIARAGYGAGIENAFLPDRRHVGTVVQGLFARIMAMTLTRHGGGQASGVVTVPQGQGSTEVLVDVSNSYSQGHALGVTASFDLEVTAGPAISGFSVGFGSERSLTVTNTEFSTYSGTVGGLATVTVVLDAGAPALAVGLGSSATGFLASAAKTGGSDGGSAVSPAILASLASCSTWRMQSSSWSR